METMGVNQSCREEWMGLQELLRKRNKNTKTFHVNFQPSFFCKAIRIFHHEIIDHTRHTQCSMETEIKILFSLFITDRPSHEKTYRTFLFFNKQNFHLVIYSEREMRQGRDDAEKFISCWGRFSWILYICVFIPLYWSATYLQSCALK